MFAVTHEDDLSCSICDTLFADPRVLPCGHSFCCKCIAQWRQNSRECPLCRGPIGPVELPKNVHLAGLVDRFRELAKQGAACHKCGAQDPKCSVCQHCRHPLCPRCVEKHVEKLRLQLRDRLTPLTDGVQRLEVGIEPLMSAQARWARAHEGLTAILTEVAKRSDRLSAAVQSRADTLHTAGQLITELTGVSGTKVAPESVMRVAKGIEKANLLTDKLGTGDGLDADIVDDLATAEQVDQMVARLKACLEVAASPGAAVRHAPPSLSTPVAASRASLSEYYTRFPQRCTNYFTVVGSVVALGVCWNTTGFLCGKGIIVSAETARAPGTAAESYKPLPGEVLVLLEGVPPHTKVKIYDLSGAYKGNVNMRLPDGSPMTGVPSYSLAVNSARQLIAVSLPKSNAVLVTSLDGVGKQLVTRCSGIDLDNPLGVCLSDDSKVYIADYRNHRVCCVSCDTGEAVRVFEDPSLARVDRLALWDCGGMRGILARVEPCHLIVLTETSSGGGFTSAKIDRKFFHFYVDPFGGLVLTSGGAAESGQLKLIPHPWLPSGTEKSLVQWQEVKYSCLSALRNGHLCAAAANRKEIHFF